MKITFVLPHLKMSGGVKVVIEYASQLSLMGHDVEVVIKNKSFVRRFIFNFVNYHPYKIKDSKVKLRKEINYKKLFSRDIILGDSWTVARDLISNGYEKKLIHFIQHDERLYHGEAKEIEKMYEKNISKVVVSSWIKKRIDKDFNCNSFLLKNPISKKIYNAKNRNTNNKIRILMLHHNYKWKGMDEGLKIIDKIKKEFSDIELVMYGARSKRFDNELCDEYHYKPIGKKLAEIYKSCDIFLGTSWDEGFGLSAIEAMACGSAVCLIDNGGCRDFAKNNETALVAPRKDYYKLEDNLKKLINDAELRKTISVNGSDYIKNNWRTLEEQSRKLEFFLEKKYKVFNS